MAFGIPEFPNSRYYDDDLRELLAMYKKVVEDYNTLVSTVEQLLKQFSELEQDIDGVIQRRIDATLVKLTMRMESLEVDMRILQKKVDDTDKELREYVDSEVSDSKTYVNRRIQSLTDILNTNIAMMNQRIDALRTYTDKIVGDINVDVDRKIEELREFVYTFTVDQVFVINPITKKRETVQEVINQIHTKLRMWAISAQEYTNCFLTADEYDKYDLTADDYDYMSRWWLKERREIYKAISDIEKWLLNKLLMNNPMTGMRETVTEVVKDMIDLLRVNSLTAAEYDGLQLTADEYDALELTAYEYDWQGLRFFAVGRYTGLTAEDYKHLGINENNVIVYGL